MQWHKAKLNEAFFKEVDRPAFLWVRDFVTAHHELPKLETLEQKFSDFVGMDTPEPSSYYTSLLENAFYHSTINKANVDSQNILKANQEDHLQAAATLQTALNTITQQRYRTKILDLGKEAPALLLQAYHAKKDESQKALFGWEYMDDQAGGALAGDVISVVGRPGLGKTWLMLYSAWKNWVVGGDILFVAMEMNHLAVAQRVTALYAGIPISQINTPGMSSYTYAKFKDGLKGLKTEKGKFFIVNGNLAASVEDIYILADQLGCTKVYIDGAYMVRNHNSKLDRFNRTAENVEQMKRYTEDLGFATFASWQFNREAAKKNHKTGKAEAALEDIGYSDAIPQISSICLGLFQEEGVETMIRRIIRVMKGRNGEIGQFTVNWNFEAMDFRQVEPPPKSQTAVSKEDELLLFI